MMDTSAPDSLSLSVQSDDDDDGCMSGQSSTFGDSSDFMAGAMRDEVTAQLAAAGWQKQHSHGDFPLLFHSFILSFATVDVIRMRDYLNPVTVAFPTQ